MKKFLLFSAAITLASCSYLPEWMGASDDGKILPGTRYAVMEDNMRITPDASLTDNVDIPEISDDAEFETHNGNFGINGNLQDVTTANAGSAADSGLFLTSQPVIAEGKIFVIDGESNVVALDAGTLKQAWKLDLDAPEEDRDLPGGGVAYAYGVLYAATGYGHVVAISASNGQELWRKDVGMALRRPPVVVDDKLFAVTADNQLFCLSVVDGGTIWRHSGARETTAVYGSSVPVIKNNVAVIAYSSGEIFGINTARGNELWSELIGLGSSRKSAAAGINDVTAAPVVADGIAYVAGHGGDLAAFNLASGFRIWSQKVGSVSATPWVAGRWIFVIGNGNNIIALNRFDGRIKWASALEKLDGKTPINWSGPVMAGGRLVVAGSHGKLIQLDPQTGTSTGETKIRDGVYSAPVVNGGKVYLLGNNADLVVVE